MMSDAILRRISSGRTRYCRHLITLPTCIVRYSDLLPICNTVAILTALAILTVTCSTACRYKHRRFE